MVARATDRGTKCTDRLDQKVNTSDPTPPTSLNNSSFCNTRLPPLSVFDDDEEEEDLLLRV